MVTMNEHGSTGMTACCKSAMGVVDMSAGRLGNDPRIADYQSIHYFGNPEATWRMAGPLAYFAREVKTPDLYLAVAEWVAISPATAAAGWTEDMDARLEAASAHRANTIIAGSDAVAIDCGRSPIRSRAATAASSICATRIPSFRSSCATTARSIGAARWTMG
jgi:hypothetical protein